MTAIMYPIFSVLHFLIVTFLLPLIISIPLFMLHICLVCTILISWTAVEMINPEDMQRVSDLANTTIVSVSNKKAHYCSVCRKYVLGIDHHCTWLNTCVGSRNYAYFFALISAASAQLLIQASVAVCVQTLWMREELQQL